MKQELGDVQVVETVQMARKPIVQIVDMEIPLYMRNEISNQIRLEI